MSDVEPPRKTALWVCTSICLLVVLYPLSAGPAAYYVQRHLTARKVAVMTTVYGPLLGIPLFRRYTKFWADLAMRP